MCEIESRSPIGQRGRGRVRESARVGEGGSGKLDAALVVAAAAAAAPAGRGRANNERASEREGGNRADLRGRYCARLILMVDSSSNTSKVKETEGERSVN